MFKQDLAIAWSPDLQADLQQLSAQKRRAILTIIQDEANGVSLLRRLKTPYSCRYCGWFAQLSIGNRDARKAALAEHTVTCENGPKIKSGEDGEPVIVEKPDWFFIANLSTYYSKWVKDDDFTDCLKRARIEFTNHALSNAAMILKLATPNAAYELVRQINGAFKDADRRLASVAILDRADLTTADKSLDPVKEWLGDLRQVEEESDQ